METRFTPASAAPHDPGQSRERKVVDPMIAVNRRIAGYKATDNDVDDPKIMVNVPHEFKLTDDGHEVHEYKAGKQKMRTSHAEHFYSIANGVRKADE